MKIFDDNDNNNSREPNKDALNEVRNTIFVKMCNAKENRIQAIRDKNAPSYIDLQHDTYLLWKTLLSHLDGMNVTYTGNDESDGILCPICGYEVARNDDYLEMYPKHCPECGCKLLY